MAIVLRRLSVASAEALRAGRLPPDVRVADDYPTEFSHGVAQHASSAGALGPFFIHRAEDDVVVGEIGGGAVAPGVIEIGYAIVTSCWGRGYATQAVRALIERARAVPGVARMVGHTPLDRPASARVLEKAGFTHAGDEMDEHEGQPIRVRRWELPLPPGAGIVIEREPITSARAAALIGALNAELSARYPEPDANHFRLDEDEVAPGRGAFLVATIDGEAVGCGALRRLPDGSAEVKRMYVAPSQRGRGLGRSLVAALEEEAARLGVRRLVLETGERQPEAVALYERLGFRRVPAFGEYTASPLSLCLAKDL